MTRGKYALRARSKRDADERYSMALAEADQLRTRLAEVRSLRKEKELLHKRIATLEAEVRDGTSAKVRQLEAVIEKTQREVGRLAMSHKNQLARYRAAAVRLVAEYPGSRNDSWWRRVEEFASAMTDLDDTWTKLPKAIRARKLRDLLKSRGGR